MAAPKFRHRLGLITSAIFIVVMIGLALYVTRRYPEMQEIYFVLMIFGVMAGATAIYQKVSGGLIRFRAAE